jgi:hypothetical protein
VREIEELIAVTWQFRVHGWKLLILTLLLLAEELEDANEEIDEIEEELQGVVGHIFVTSFGLQDHDLGVKHDICREDEESKESNS